MAIIKSTTDTAQNLKDMLNMIDNQNAQRHLPAKVFSYAIDWMKMKEMLPHDFRMTAYEEGFCMGVSNEGMIVWNSQGKAFQVNPSEEKTIIWSDEEERPVIAKKVIYKEIGYLSFDPSALGYENPINQQG